MQLQAIQLEEKNRLFHDYLYDFQKVRKFYAFHYRNEWAEAIKARQVFSLNRQAISEVLFDLHGKWQAPGPVMENIEKLRHENTLAVVTGQQVGIFTGPLYTVYKTITIIKLAEELKRQYPEHHFVPVFWMEVDDHDFKEINHIQYINKENKVKRLMLEESPEESLKPIFARQLRDGLLAWEEALEVDFFDTEFKSEVLRTFFDCYGKGRHYQDAFAMLMLKIFGSKGLILLNPTLAAVKRLVKPLLGKALNESKKLLEIFNQRNQELEMAGYPRQIHLRDKQTLLFFVDKEMHRARVDFTDSSSRFSLKYPEAQQHVPSDELQERLDQHPEWFTPNVALRPLIQDSLLPTVAYVGGPAEITYYSQVQTLYQYFQIPMPVIYPRHRFTIVEKKLQKIVEKFKLNYEQVINLRSHFRDRFITENVNQSLFNEVRYAEGGIIDFLSKLKPLIESLDPTLLKTLENTRDRIQSNLQYLTAKLIRSLEEKSVIQMRQVDKLLLHLVPENHLQERFVNVIYFYIKYGMDFTDRLCDKAPVDTRPHYVVLL